MARQAKRFVYYQPNDKDLKDNYGDCQIRALSKAFGVSWVEAFKMEIPYCIEYQCNNIFSVDISVRHKIMDELGFSYHGVSNKAGAKRPTVDSFAKDHPSGTYILVVANHVVACVDGKYYDTWNCGDRSMYGWYEKEPL